ncbi:MAG: SulP family inorganic anion transporter [Acetobacteraceae bacterium]
MNTPRISAGDVWGGVSAMLVALPSSIAFGVTIFASLGANFAAQGAVAGILGAMAIGLVAPALGGTNRLISAPCAPAAAVLSALAITLTAQHVAPETVALMLGIAGLMTGLLQIGFGAVGLGRLIKYMPYPVVSGYLSGVGLVIIIQQVPKLLGAPRSMGLIEALGAPSAWQWRAIVVGAVTIGAVLVAPKITKAVPAAIAGLLAGVATYFLLALGDRSLLVLAGNAAVLGPLSGGGVLDLVTARFAAAGGLDRAQLASLLVPALTLAVLLSIDTLKTCVVVDAITRTRHDSNRELRAQGIGNIVATIVGGIPGSGTMGPTVVNISSGAQTRLSGMVEGIAALVAFLVLGSVLAWIPVAALAGILIVVGARMFDLHSLRLLRSRATVLDFVVIAAVVVVAITVSLIAASATGVGLAILLFIREQTRASVVHRQTLGSQTHSKQVRLPHEAAVLDREGERTAIFELQGSLFFGTADQLYSVLEPHLKTRRFLLLDMRRVRSVDVTAAHILELVGDMLQERGGHLLFSALPRIMPGGVDARRFLGDLGFYEHLGAKAFGELDAALEWVEDQILAEAHLELRSLAALALEEFDLFRGRRADTLEALAACVEARSYAGGARIFAAGDTGDELFLIRRGAVRIVLAGADGSEHHLATFRRGSFFGEMAFLDREPRSAVAVAERETELFVLSRARFDQLVAEHRRLGIAVLDGIARVLALRLRRTDQELQALQEG